MLGIERSSKRPTTAAGLSWPGDKSDMKDLSIEVEVGETPHSDLTGAVDILKALGHAGRLSIMCELLDGEKSVNMLEARLGIRQASVSQQLARLRQDGMVRHRREGKSIFYSVANTRVRDIVETVRSEFALS